MDNGGELAESNEFQDQIHNYKYILETTAPGWSSQNGLAERPYLNPFSLKREYAMVMIY